MKSLVGLTFLCLVGGSLCAPDGGSSRATQGGIQHFNGPTSSPTRSSSVHKNPTRTSYVSERFQKRRAYQATHNTLTPAAVIKIRSSSTTYSDPSFPSDQSASSGTQTSQAAKRGLSHSDPNLPLGSRPGVSASTEAPVLSALSTSVTRTSVSASGVPSSVSAATTVLPPIQSHPEQGRPPRKHNAHSSRRDLKIRDAGDTSLNSAPTPAPTGPSSEDTTVHISGETDFALLLPGREGESIGDAESDGVAYCSPGSTFTGCSHFMQDGFITAAALAYAPDNTSWIQVTGCLDPSKMSNVDPSDKGGQFDVRFPNGAQCSFGGYGASFVELVEPAGNRFCLRCCAEENDQTNCNSHQDRTGCPNAVPGTYDFPEQGISCSG